MPSLEGFPSLEDRQGLERALADLVLSTSDAGVAVDCLCVANDPDFRPAGRGREPTDPPAALTLKRCAALSPG